VGRDQSRELNTGVLHLSGGGGGGCRIVEEVFVVCVFVWLVFVGVRLGCGPRLRAHRSLIPQLDL